MNFQDFVSQGTIRKTPKDSIRAESLFVASSRTLASTLRIPPDENSYQQIIRELYESMRQLCEAIGYLHGYKFSSHEPISNFIDEILHEPLIATKFDRYRRLRNGINYYGDEVSPETVKNALIEIPKIINALKKHERNGGLL
ncbi:MAG TPA: hypothetical protein VJJ82_04580 [Candidatus Nanoarchaeia archaeon]|nr:hypothetical protein [Candidatus Nanoarchaeia archaeon]